MVIVHVFSHDAGDRSCSSSDACLVCCYAFSSSLNLSQPPPFLSFSLARYAAVQLQDRQLLSLIAPVPISQPLHLSLLLTLS